MTFNNVKNQFFENLQLISNLTIAYFTSLHYQISAPADAAQRKQEGVSGVDFGQTPLPVKAEGNYPPTDCFCDRAPDGRGRSRRPPFAHGVKVRIGNTALLSHFEPPQNRRYQTPGTSRIYSGYPSRSLIITRSSSFILATSSRTIPSAGIIAQ